VFDSLPRSFTLALGATLALTTLALEPATVDAQQKTAPPAPAAAPAPAHPTSGYVYDASGRRDPFRALDAVDPRLNSSSKATGLAGLLINEATVKGVVKSRGRMMAMVQAPDNKTYIVKASDRLFDGEVRAVTAEAVVFVQNVNDPLSPVRQREIRKPLRIVEEGK
jgi:pyruvate/2-oxoglutarate dehydrogenase complex dihydrolipoamide acyltransferase (E2) component